MLRVSAVTYARGGSSIITGALHADLHSTELQKCSLWAANSHFMYSPSIVGVNTLLSFCIFQFSSMVKRDDTVNGKGMLWVTFLDSVSSLLSECSIMWKSFQQARSVYL